MVDAGPAPQAFDILAADYDRRFSDHPVGHLLRRRVHDCLAPHLPAAGGAALEIGCGTGIDALWLRGAGLSVRATDPSAAMLAEARQRAAAAGAGDIDFARADAGAAVAGSAAYDLVFYNFGAVNCIADLAGFCAALADSVKPGGVVALVVMGPVCLWEILWYALRGDFGRAFRRWRQHQSWSAGAADISLSYPAARRIGQLAGTLFRRRLLSGIGVFLPPSYVFGALDRHPRLRALLATLERWLAGLPPLRYLGDHYLLILERVGNPGSREAGR